MKYLFYGTKFPCFLSFLRKFFDVSFHFFENSSIFRSFETSFHRNFVSLSEFSIDHATFLRKLFEFSKKDREISFEISLKIRKNKGRISTNFALITFAQYCRLFFLFSIIFTRDLHHTEAHRLMGRPITDPQKPADLGATPGKVTKNK